MKSLQSLHLQTYLVPIALTQHNAHQFPYKSIHKGRFRSTNSDVFMSSFKSASIL